MARRHLSKSEQKRIRSRCPAPFRCRGAGPNRAGMGFTLMEVVVALAVLAVVLVSVFRMQTGNLGVVERLNFNTRAAMLAQAKMAELDATGIDDNLETQGDFGDEAPGYHWQVTVNPRDDELLGQAAQRLYRIEIRIDLNQDESVFHLRTQRLASP
ncbi:MAG TPA: prepilin-type N-terminal cleavage/methylation domain-containing protein [Desulfobacteraceae bacterium]|nr:prepilin-type N-terminal cleavage/methylation domain-containing protein [Desulfobacteraceae bacterium]